MKVSFYCKNCELDQDLEAITESNQWAKWFRADCKKCGKKVIRYITDMEKDPYYYKSKNVIINRQKFGKDLLQPNDYGFRTYYKQEYEKIQKQKEEFEKKQEAEKKDKDKFFRGHSYNIVEKNLARKILQKEEEIKYGGN